MIMHYFFLFSGALLSLLPSQMSDLASLTNDAYQSCLEWSALEGTKFNKLDYSPLVKAETEVPMILKDTNAVLVRMSLVIMQKSPSIGKLKHFTHFAYDRTDQSEDGSLLISWKI